MNKKQKKKTAVISVKIMLISVDICGFLWYNKNINNNKKEIEKMNNLKEKAKEMVGNWESYETEHIKGELLRNLTPLEEWDEFTPMWGIMWRLDKKTERWALDNIDKVSKIGLRLYVLTSGTVVLGVDGAGFDFCQAYWVPLYKEINGIK